MNTPPPPPPMHVRTMPSSPSYANSFQYGIPVVVLFVYKEHSVAQIWNYIELS